MITPKSQSNPPPINDWIFSDVTIEEPQGDTVSVIPFHLWPAQRDALETIQHEPQVIILKARQLGISWLVIAYALWLCLFHANKLVMVFSKDQDSANEMIRRAKGIYNRLTRKPVALTVDNVTTIGWANGSRVKSFAAKNGALPFTSETISPVRNAEMLALYTPITSRHGETFQTCAMKSVTELHFVRIAIKLYMVEK